MARELNVRGSDRAPQKKRGGKSKWVLIILAVLVVVGLAGRRRTDADQRAIAQDGDSAGAASDVTSDAGTVVGDDVVDGMYAKLATNSLGCRVIVFTVEWTNGSGRPASAGFSFSPEAWQGDKELSMGALTGSDVYDAGSSLDQVEDGGKGTAQWCFALENLYEPVELRLYEYLGSRDTYVSKSWPIVREGALLPNVGDFLIQINDFQIVENSIHQQVAIVTADVANLGAKPEMPNFNITCSMYQNGNELGLATVSFDDRFDFGSVGDNIDVGTVNTVYWAAALEDMAIPVDVKIFAYRGDPDSGIAESFQIDDLILPVATQEPLYEPDVPASYPMDDMVTDMDPLDRDLKTAKVMNGSNTQAIGTRGYVILSPEEFESIAQDQLVSFARNRVNGSGYNWVSIMCTDGRGIVFEGSLIEIASVGELRSDGTIETLFGYLRLSGDQYSYVEE